MSIKWNITNFGYVCGAKTTDGKWPQSVKIPSIIGDKVVVGIGQYLFADNNFIQSVDIPASVVRIDTGAFQHCHNLKTVNFEEYSRLEFISSCAFWDCCLESFPFEKLYRLSSLGCGSFAENPIDKVDLSATAVEEIDSECFKNSNLSEIKFSKKLYFIGVDSFLSTKLTAVDFSNISEVDSICINNSAFKYCKNLERITFSNINTYIGAESFYNCSKLKSVVIPPNVALGDYSFAKCDNLKTIVFEKGSPLGEALPANVFSCCSNLEDVQMNTDFTTIGSEAFKECCSLKTIIFPETLNKINTRAFFDCSKITAVDLTNRNIQEIGNGSFAWTKFQIDNFKMDFTCATEFDVNAFLGNYHILNENLQKKYPFSLIIG